MLMFRIENKTNTISHPSIFNFPIFICEPVLLFFFLTKTIIIHRQTNTNTENIHDNNTIASISHEDDDKNE